MEPNAALTKLEGIFNELCEVMESDSIPIEKHLRGPLWKDLEAAYTGLAGAIDKIKIGRAK